MFLFDIGATWRTAFFGCLALASTTASAHAAVISGEEYLGVTTDAFDLSQGTVVTAFSSAFPGFSPGDVFGGTASGIEPGNFIFTDGFAVNNVDYIDFETPSAIHLTGIVLGIADDSNFQGNIRGSNTYTLYSSDDGINYNNIVSNSSLASNYLNSYGDDQLKITDDVNVTAKYFRLAVTRDTTYGPRIYELDAITAVPEPSSFALVAGLVGGAWWKRRKSAAVVPA